ncbi:MAG: NADH-quinone oxidoreductase subunit A [Ignavibacteria bacterium]|nr:NADH-quinone oxidoreductase subunit A [Ignavibacteria bacterium]
MLADYAQILVFMIVAVGFVAIAFIAALLIAPKRPSSFKNTTYECGEDTVGDTWVRFNVRFYVVALIFIIFDVEIIFLFPWAVVFKELGMFAFIEMAIFLIILIFGFIYALAKGDLRWDKPEPVIPKLERQTFKAE